ncbi:MAG: DUF3857 domain-containing protein, partial [Bacteroidota bacterium]
MRRWVCIMGMMIGLGPFFLLGQTVYDPTSPVTEETWNMEIGRFAGDAPAVILLDYGWASYSPLNNTFLTQHQYVKRIRIQSEEGIKQANVSLSYDTREKRLVQISAVTYSLNPEGEIIKFKVPKRAFVKEGSKVGIQTVKFTLPLVKVGSIIEYTYTLESRRQNEVMYWRFEDTLPILHSEYQVFLPHALNFRKFTRGDISRVNVSSTPFTLNGGPSPGLSTADRLNTYERESRQALFRFGRVESYTMDSIVAIEPEPFALNPEAYIPSIGFEKIEDKGKSSGNSTFEQWTDLNRFVLKVQKERKLKPPNNLLTQNYPQSERLERKEQIGLIEQIYRSYRQKLRWNEEFSWRAKRLDKVWQNREGNSAELNLLLCFALRQAGLNASPVLVRTVDNGPIIPNYPSLQQFNHLIVAVDLVEQFLLLDLINETDAFNLLPAHDLNQLGLRVDPENPMWVS